MIQRIQSLYLFLTSLVSILFLKGPFLTFFDKSGSEIKLTFSGIFKFAVNADTFKMGESWPLLVMVVLIPLLSLVIIFFYKNRSFQLLLSGILILLVSVFIGVSLVYTYTIISQNDAAFSSWYKLIIPAIQLMLSFLAYRGIKKDDNLVKSYDRLR
jgi:hypothetical protein